MACLPSIIEKPEDVLRRPTMQADFFSTLNNTDNLVSEESENIVKLKQKPLRPKPDVLNLDEAGMVNFVVRNTFIDCLPDTPQSPFGFLKERQAQSCPSTSLLPYAVPLPGLGGIPGIGLGLPGSGQSPTNAGSYPERPWSADIVAELVATAAALVEAHTPSLSGASRRGSPLFPAAQKSNPGLVSPTMASTTPEARSSPAMERFCATPSPWTGAAVLRSSPASVGALAMPYPRSFKGDGALKRLSEDPVAMLVASAAAAATEQSQTSPVTYGESPPGLDDCSPKFDVSSCLSPETLAFDSPRAISNPLCVGLKHTRLAQMDDLSWNTESLEQKCPGALAKHTALDAKAVAQSFAALVTPESATQEGFGMHGQQWWSPVVEAIPELVPDCRKEPVDGPDLENFEDLSRRIAAFVQRWGLDDRAEQAIRVLPPAAQQEIINSFSASAMTKNVNAKFMSWLSSKMRFGAEFQSCLETSAQERQDFYRRWRLDNKCQQLVEEQPPHIQRELISNFNPPIGTKNVDGRMTAFLNMILSKTNARAGGPCTVPDPTFPQGAVTCSVSQPVSLDTEVQAFATRWKLDAGARAALWSLPDENKKAVLSGFKPPSNTESVSKKFVAYLRSSVRPMGRGKTISPADEQGQASKFKRSSTQKGNSGRQTDLAQPLQVGCQN